MNADAVAGGNSSTGVALVPSSGPSFSPLAFMTHDPIPTMQTPPPRNVVIPTVPSTSTSNTTAMTTPTAIAIPLPSNSNSNNNNNSNTNNINDTSRLITLPNNQPHAPLNIAGGNGNIGINPPLRGTNTSQRNTDNTSLPSNVASRNSNAGSSGSWRAVFTRSVQRFSVPWRQYQPAPGHLEEGEVDHPLPLPVNHRPPDTISGSMTVPGSTGATLYNSTATSNANTAPGI